MDLLDSINKKSDGLFVFLLVITSLLFLVGLGQRHLWEADEPREAGIIAEMSRTGDYVVPRLNGAPFLEKPPVCYWISSAVFHLLGENDYSCRVPSALASIGGVLLVYGLARKMGSSPLTAFISGFILATSAEYWNLGRQCLVDMTLCFFVTASMVCYFSAVKTEPFRILWDIGFVLSLAGALMTKGLVGLAIPASAIFVWLLLERNFSLRPWLLLFAGSILCLIPAAIWIWLLCKVLGQQFVYDAVLANNFGRFTGGYAQHVGPFYYYLKNFPGQFMPWFLFVPMAVFFLVRDISLKKRCESLFVLAWFVIPFILLSIAAGKRAMYLLPLYPAAALFVGIALGAVIEGKKFPRFWFDIPAAIVA